MLLKILVFISVIGFLEGNFVNAGECKTSSIIVQPRTAIADADNQEYSILNLDGFVQNSTSVVCLPDQSCQKGKCQQDYKLHQFLALPAGKQLFAMNDLKFEFFKIPYGCKCVP